MNQSIINNKLINNFSLYKEKKNERITNICESRYSCTSNK